MSERTLSTSLLGPEKDYGVFSAIITPVEAFDEKVRRAFDLPSQGQVVELHMDRRVTGTGDYGYYGILGTIREAFESIAADILAQENFNVHAVFAITNKVAARASRRFGFAIQEIPDFQIDDLRKQRARAGYELTDRGPNKRKEEKIAFFGCIQSLDNFLRIFGMLPTVTQAAETAT